MTAINTILKRLPALKSSADFDAALADLETEHTAALAAVSELEAGREAAIFSGGDLAKLASDIGAAEGSAKTLGIAMEGARKRREAAVEAEVQAELEAKGATARKLNAKLKTTLIAFARVAEELAGHAETIKGLRAEILTLNNVLREGGRSDLVASDPVPALVEIVGRHVIDPVGSLIIPEYYPHRASGGPALARLTK